MKNYIENILLGVCEKLQLSPSLYDQAKDRYNTISQTIKEDDAFKNITLNIYPQGSFRLKTTVKPLSGEEYDLDFVAELPSGSEMTPTELYNNIVRILKNDGVHNKMVELKSRCVRINYANDFHLDIMPGKLLDNSTHEIIVPDKKLQGWYHHSNPIGFADWFEKQARTRLLMEITAFRRAQANVEDVTEQEITNHLEPLRRAVQLIKRYRDIYCSENNKEPVRSIVICTLMGQIGSFYGDSLYIIQSFCEYVNSLISQSGDVPFVVKNPVVDEVLTEKWSEGNNYKDFVSMMNALTSDVKALRGFSTNTDTNKIVKKMFGETITNAVITDYARRISEARVNGNLTVKSNGVLNTDKAGISVKKNTFYGNV